MHSPSHIIQTLKTLWQKCFTLFSNSSPNRMRWRAGKEKADVKCSEAVNYIRVPVLRHSYVQQAECVRVYMSVYMCFYMCVLCILILYTVQKDILSTMQSVELCICDAVMLCSRICCRSEWQRDWLEPIILLQTRPERRCRATELAWDTHAALD